MFRKRWQRARLVALAAVLVPVALTGPANAATVCVDVGPANQFDGYRSTTSVSGVTGSIVDRDAALCTPGDPTSAFSAWVMLGGGGADQYAQVGYARGAGMTAPVVFTEYNDGTGLAPGWTRSLFTGWVSGSTKTYSVIYNYSTAKIGMYANGQLLSTTPWCADCVWTPGWTAQFFGETIDRGDDVPGTSSVKTSFTNLSARYCRSCAYTAPVVAAAGSTQAPYKFQWVSNPTSFNIWTQR